MNEPFNISNAPRKSQNLPAKIISGGQTGADTGALMAARELGIETGGVVPKGWLTENGAEESTLRSFGLMECEEPGYAPRTRSNVIHSDGTLLLGDDQIGGTRLTAEIARELNKPVFRIASVDLNDRQAIEEFRSWLRRSHINVLNVAGNRESEMTGISELTRIFLIEVLRQDLG